MTPLQGNGKIPTILQFSNNNIFCVYLLERITSD